MAGQPEPKRAASPGLLRQWWSYLQSLYRYRGGNAKAEPRQTRGEPRRDTRQS